MFLSYNQNNEDLDLIIKTIKDNVRITNKLDDAKYIIFIIDENYQFPSEVLAKKKVEKIIILQSNKLKKLVPQNFIGCHCISASSKKKFTDLLKAISIGSIGKVRSKQNSSVQKSKKLTGYANIKMLRDAKKSSKPEYSKEQLEEILRIKNFKIQKLELKINELELSPFPGLEYLKAERLFVKSKEKIMKSKKLDP